MSLFELKHVNKVIQDRQVDLFIDSFDKISHNDDSCLFLSQVNLKTINEDKLISRIQKNIKNAIVKDVKLGKAKRNKKTVAGKQNTFAFVKFDNSNAIPQALKIDKQLIN